MTKHLGNTLLAVRPLLPAVALAGLLACNGTGGPRASHPRPATTVNETAVTTVPEPPASEPGALGDQLAALEAALRAPAAPEASLPALGRAELLAYRRLAHHPDWLPVALARVPGATQEAVRRNLTAQLELEALTPPRTSPPPWQVAPPPAAPDLLSFYREAEAATGVSWASLAAIHFVETNMGRIHSPPTIATSRTRTPPTSNSGRPRPRIRSASTGARIRRAPTATNRAPATRPRARRLPGRQAPPSSASRDDRRAGLLPSWRGP